MFHHTFNLLMGRSLSFGSHTRNLTLFFKLVFTAPIPNGLSLLRIWTRWPIMQKVRRHKLI